jgi:hypothetical protein
VHHRFLLGGATALLGLLGLTACGDPTAFLYGDVDRQCVPEWPDCLDSDGTSGGDPETATCDVELLPGEREEVGCVGPGPDGECLAAEEPCLLEAFENRFQITCEDCLREDFRVLCGPEASLVPDVCCYRVGIVRPGCGDES